MQRPIDGLLKELERIKQEIETYRFQCKHEQLSDSHIVYAIPGSSYMAKTCLNCDLSIPNNDPLPPPINFDRYTLANINEKDITVFPLDDYYERGLL